MRPGDFIYVKNLAIKATAGLDAWRRAINQPLNVSLKIFMNHRLRTLGLTDDLRRSLNYDSLSTELVKSLESSPSKSISEALKKLSETIKPQLSPFEHAHITVDQPKHDLFASLRRTEIKTNSSVVFESFKNAQIPVIIGINPLERVYKQPIQLDIEVSHNNDNEVLTHDFHATLVEYVAKSQWLTIESFVNDLARLVCTTHLDILDVKVRASKPCALNLADGAAVQVTRKPSDFQNLTEIGKDGEHLVYIAFGTNIGPRLGNIRQAIKELETRGIFVEKSSNIYESVPMYFSDQPLFMNGVFRCRTKHNPEELLAQLKEVEYKIFGRVKIMDNGPRPLDLDIILFDNEFIETDLLTIPHKDMLNRSFVLKPLSDVMPNCPFPTISNDGGAGGAAEGGINRVLPLRNEDYFVLNKTHIMSILNATPDSFSDGNGEQHQNPQEYALNQFKLGAEIIDVGGYSTRPGATNVSEKEEIRRVCYAIEQVKLANENAVVSVDTFRSEVANEALKLGASMVNDVFSGQLDKHIFDVVSKHEVPLVLNHSRGTPQNMHKLVNYTQLIPEVANELNKFVDQALSRGVQYWQLVLDPGLGFAKTQSQDLEIIKNFQKLKHFCYDLPWLVGPSRKRFIGHVLNEPVPRNRDIGTQTVLTALIAQNVDFVRVHNTSQAVDTAKVADQIYRST